MGLRVAELETLFTANTDQIEKADRLQKQMHDRAEKPIKLDADARGVLGSMDRVGKEVKKLVSADTIVKLDADISKAQGQLDRAVVKLEDLQVRAEGGLDVTADTKRAEAQIQKLERSIAGLKKSRAAFDIDADGQQALAELRKVDSAAQRLVSADVVAKVDADITYAQKNVTRIQAQLEVLRSTNPSPKVLVDISRAEGQLDTAKRKLDGLSAARASMKVDADTSAAESALKQVDGVAGKAGADSGRSFTSSLDAATRGAGEKVGEAVGSGVEDTLIQALAAIPVAGGIVLAGVAIGKAITGAIQDGLNVEKSMDRLAALTGLGDADAQRIARGAGEAYANTFGTSIESNMDVARLALQFRIIDPKATSRDAQEVVQGLAGIADVLDEDVRPTAVAVTQLLRTGLAKSSKEAFDILAAGARNGVNTAEDMLDTFTEYPVVLSRLGLSGAESLGLISQALKAGARNSDVAADALKEFQIRATDGSKLSAQGFETLGLSAEEMTAKIAAGGDSARDGLGLVLDKLREIEDPVARNAAAVALFGTKAEDMGAALFSMDLSSAVDQLDGVTGAAKRMFDTLSSNDATKIEQAQRNIEVASDGIKAALAAAFSEPLGDFAKWVSANRGPLTQFLLDLASGAIDFGEAVVNATADGVEGLGHLLGPIADVVEGYKTMVKLQNPFADTSDLETTINGLRGFAKGSDDVADSMRENLIPRMEEAKEKLHEWGDPVVQLGYVNDATIRLASAIDSVALSADGSKRSLEGMNFENLSATQNGAALADAIRNANGALDEQISAAAAAGESQTNLTDRYKAGREALVNQLVAMGISGEEAWKLVDAYSNIPEVKATDIQSNAPQKTVEIDGVTYAISRIPGSKSVTLVAYTGEAENALNYAARDRTSWITVRTTGDVIVPGAGGRFTRDYYGSIKEFMANGGIRGPLSPMQPIAQMVPPNTWRVVGDRGDVPEAYIPLDGSPRSHALLAETIARMPGYQAMANGGVVGGGPAVVDGRIVALLEKIASGPDGANAVVLLLQRIAAAVESGRRDSKSDSWNAMQVANAAQGL